MNTNANAVGSQPVSNRPYGSHSEETMNNVNQMMEENKAERQADQVQEGETVSQVGDAVIGVGKTAGSFCPWLYFIALGGAIIKGVGEGIKTDADPESTTGDVILASVMPTLTSGYLDADMFKGQDAQQQASSTGETTLEGQEATTNSSLANQNTSSPTDGINMAGAGSGASAPAG